MQSYTRDGGLWDLEAELIDVKAYDFPKRDGEVFKAGDPIHHMHLRITIDGDFTIVAAQAVYDAAPYGGHCMAIEPAYTDLIGMNLLKGFRRQVKAFRARGGLYAHDRAVAGASHRGGQTMANQRRQESNPNRRPFQLDGCHALRTDGPVVAEHYPKWYTGDSAEASAGSASDSPSFSHTS